MAAGDDPTTGWRLRRLLYVNLVAAVAFVFGGSLFALGAVFAELGVGSLSTVNVTYLVGGFFFTLGGYVSILLASNADSDERMRWWAFLPRRRDWLSAFVLFVGTLFFAVSLVAAFAQGLTPRQSNGWIWLPDITGCVCFLASGRLAMLEVCGGHVRVLARRRRLVGGRGQPARLGPLLPRRPRGLHPPGHLQRDQHRPRQLGDVRRRRSASPIGGVIQAFDTPTPTRTVVQQKP